MTFNWGQFYTCEMPSATANDVVGRNMAIGSVRKHFMASPTFEGQKPAMIVVMVPEDALSEVSKRVRGSLDSERTPLEVVRERIDDLKRGHESYGYDTNKEVIRQLDMLYGWIEEDLNGSNV